MMVGSGSHPWSAGKLGCRVVLFLAVFAAVDVSGAASASPPGPMTVAVVANPSPDGPAVVVQSGRLTSGAGSPVQVLQSDGPTVQGSGSAPLPPGTYRLQLGDVLEIRHFYTPELNAVVPIRPDGRISLDLIGEVDAAGRTPSDLQVELMKRYSASLRRPEVAVIVKDFGGAKVYVAGEVVTPGVVRNVGNLTLVQSIFQAGGFKRTAQLKSVVVLRNQGTAEPLFMVVDVKARLQKVSSTPDLVLQPNDVVFVPNTRIAKLDDFVDQYIRQLIPIGISWVIGGTFVWSP